MLVSRACNGNVHTPKYYKQYVMRFIVQIGHVCGTRVIPVTTSLLSSLVSSRQVLGGAWCGLTGTAGGWGTGVTRRSPQGMKACWRGKKYSPLPPSEHASPPPRPRVSLPISWLAGRITDTSSPVNDNLNILCFPYVIGSWNTWYWLVVLGSHRECSGRGYKWIL